MGTPECDDPMQSWCPSLAECIVEHIQSCPPGSSDSELSMVAASDGESKSGSMLITTAVAIVTIIAANELLKHIVKQQSEKVAAVERTRSLEVDSQQKSVWDGERAQKLMEEAEAVAAEKKREEAEIRRRKLERQRELYGFKDWKKAQKVRGQAEEAEVRAAQVADHDAAAGEREEALAAKVAAKKAARLAEVARQRKAYGLRAAGRTLGGEMIRETAEESPPSVRAARFERAQQDWQYEEALRTDEAAAIEEQRAQDEADAAAARAEQQEAADATELAREIEPLAILFDGSDTEPDVASGVSELALELPSGDRLTRRFDLTTQCGTVHKFIRLALLRTVQAGSRQDADSEAKATAAMTKSVLNCGWTVCANFGPSLPDTDTTLQAAGLSRREKLIVRPNK